MVNVESILGSLRQKHEEADKNWALKVRAESSKNLVQNKIIIIIIMVGIHEFLYFSNNTNKVFFPEVLILVQDSRVRVEE